MADKNSRRLFLRLSGMLGLGAFSKPDFSFLKQPVNVPNGPELPDPHSENGESIIGTYGGWAEKMMDQRMPSHSFRRDEWKDLDSWKQAALEKAHDRIAAPDLGEVPKAVVNNRYTFDGLEIEEISWQLPTGGTSEAIVLKPENSKGRLPAILAFHDHGGWKYFGKRKITQTSAERHPMIVDHQNQYYEGLGWANEAAKRGYVVMVPDAFPFESRRVRIEDVPKKLRNGLDDAESEKPEHVKAYNGWARGHAGTMAKSLFSAGTTWPGVFFAEDQKALDILCNRDDVDPEKIGCGGLSGGGMRTVFTGGLDPRIKCAVCVGFMTTWKDMALYKSFTHTWMAFVPVLAKELDFPEILGLRVPLPTMVINSVDDGLYTLKEMEKADIILKKVYEKASASDKYNCTFFPGGHKFDRNMQKTAFDWFDKWLKA